MPATCQPPYLIKAKSGKKKKKKPSQTWSFYLESLQLRGKRE